MVILFIYLFIAVTPIRLWAPGGRVGLTFFLCPSTDTSACVCVRSSWLTLTTALGTPRSQWSDRGSHSLMAWQPDPSWGQLWPGVSMGLTSRSKVRDLVRRKEVTVQYILTVYLRFWASWNIQSLCLPCRKFPVPSPTAICLRGALVIFNGKDDILLWIVHDMLRTYGNLSKESFLSRATCAQRSIPKCNTQLSQKNNHITSFPPL